LSAEFTIKEGHDIRDLFPPGRATWVGKGAGALELTGDVDPADFEALSELVTYEDEDQGDVSPYEAQTAESGTLLDQMRRDGLL
jgi:hypothetical protein